MSQKDATKSAQELLQKAGTVSMEYLNIFKTKLTNTVVDTVYMAESITKTVLPGNPVTREYEITKHIGSAGPGLLWKLYAGFKRSTKQEATVFVLHKKLLETYSKRDRDFIVEAFKKGATQLARIKHPRVVGLQHQLEESKDSLAFATEPCFCSLANALGNHENMPFPLPADFTEFKLLEVEIKYGLMQISEGLSFLHKDVKLLHRNICPESIIITINGAWKIAGFELFVTNINDPNDAIKYPFKEWDGSLSPILNPPLEYLAPEYGISSSCDTSSDMFSYGMLFYSVFNNGKTLYKCNSSYPTFVNNVEDLKKLTNSQFGSIPTDVREYLKLLLHINPELRPDAGQVAKIPFFDDVAVKTLEYLDSTFQVDNLQKSMFFKSLPQIIDKLPQRVCLQRIIPCLEQEFINPDMIPFLLPSIFLIADQSNNDEFVKYILPRLKIIFKVQKPIQILLIVLRNMNMVLAKTPATDIKEHILPLVCRSLESDSVEIQELCLANLPTFTNLLDTQTIKHQLIPRIKKLCLESQTITVRVNSLVCIGKILEFLEKWVVLDDILPILEKITFRDPAILMGMLGIYKIILTHPKLGITKDLLATRVIPFLVPICIDSNLNMKQFSAYISLVKEMLTQIENEQKKKLEQIEIMEREKSIIPYAMANASRPNLEAQKPSETMMDKLMIGYGITNNSNNSHPNFPSQALVPSGDSSLKSNQNQPKKDLTLAEKQQIASKLENDTQNGHKTDLTSSISLQNIKSNNRNMTDSLLDKNLADLSFSSSTNQQKPSMSNSMSTNFALLTQMNNSTNNPNMSVQAATSFNLSNNNNNNNSMMYPSTQNKFQTPTSNNFNNNNNNNSSSFFNNQQLNSSFNNNNNMTNGGALNQSQLFNNSNNSQFNKNNSNSLDFNAQTATSQSLGFFGNLALPAGPSPTSPSSSNNSNTIPNLAPPPTKTLNQLSTNKQQTNSVLKPTSVLNNNNNNNSTNKKSAFDDLADLLG